MKISVKAMSVCPILHSSYGHNIVKIRAKSQKKGVFPQMPYIRATWAHCNVEYHAAQCDCQSRH